MHLDSCELLFCVFVRDTHVSFEGMSFLVWLIRGRLFVFPFGKQKLKASVMQMQWNNKRKSHLFCFDDFLFDFFAFHTKKKLPSVVFCFKISLKPLLFFFVIFFHIFLHSYPKYMWLIICLYYTQLVCS